MTKANYVAFTAPINPPAAEPQLTLDQVWALLRRKVRRAQDFVPVAISATEVEVSSSDTHARPVTTRVVTFRAGFQGREEELPVREVCTEFRPMMVDFVRPDDGSRVQNIVSRDATGALHMTYTFEWLHPELGDDDDNGAAALAEARAREQAGAQAAVEGTIRAMREMVADGRWKETVD